MAQPTLRPIELVVTDVDGTLVGSDRTLAASTIKAAARLRAAGCRLALVSARATAGLDVLLGPLGIDTPRAGFNGGVILHPDGSVVREFVIDQAAAAEAVRLLEAAGLDVWVFASNAWYLTNPDAHYIASEQRSILMDWRTVDTLAPRLSDVHKIMGSSRDFALVEQTAQLLHDALGDRANVQRSQHYYIDVTPPEADKGRALEVIAMALGIELAAVAAIGDMPNDLAMFRRAGLSIAMGNALPEVKQQAGHVVADNDSGGWSEAIALILDLRSRQ